MNTNLKDKITNMCGIVLAAVSVVPMLKEAGIILPEYVNTISITAGTIAGAVIAYFTGKNHDGSSKQSPTKS